MQIVKALENNSYAEIIIVINKGCNGHIIDKIIIRQNLFVKVYIIHTSHSINLPCIVHIVIIHSIVQIQVDVIIMTNRFSITNM